MVESGGIRSEYGVLELGTGVVVWGIGGLRDWFVSFSCGEKEKDALRRPQNKNEKIKYRFYEPFSFVSFSAFAWCKGSVFFVCFGKNGVFFGFSIGVFSVFGVHCGVFMVQMRRSRTSKR